MANAKNTTPVDVDPTVTETSGAISDPIEGNVSKAVVTPKPTPEDVKPNLAKPKTLENTCENGCKENVPDVTMYGEDLFKLLSKASSEAEGWMKSTKGMNTPGGVVIQVTTQQRNPDGSYAVAEAVTFVPNCAVTERGDGYYLK